MNTINWDTYKFRPSGLAKLMTNSRTKSDPLSETTKTYLRELYILEVFLREKYDSKNKYTEKGIACESDSLDLIQKVLGKTYFKNKKQLENDFVKGTPDVIDVKKVIDIKTSWDIWTFAGVDETKALKEYYWQLLAYMWLTNKSNADLMFCLVNTPEHIMYDELRLLSYRYPEIDQSEEVMERVKRNYLFDDIPEESRIKNFSISYNADDIEKLKERILLSREYLKTITL